MRLTMDHASEIFGRIEYLNHEYNDLLGRCRDAGIYVPKESAVPGRKALLEPRLTLTLDCLEMALGIEQIIDAAKTAGHKRILDVSEAFYYDLFNLYMEIKNS